MALTALILGIVGFLTGFLFIGILLDVAAVVLGIVALVKIKNEPARYGGKGMAITGIVVGGLGLLFMIIILASAPALIDFAVEQCRADPSQPNCDQILEQYGDEDAAEGRAADGVAWRRDFAPERLGWPSPSASAR